MIDLQFVKMKVACVFLLQRIPDILETLVWVKTMLNTLVVTPK